MSLETKYIWLNWEFVEWDKATDHTVIHWLHYWTSIFEWIRFYETSQTPAIFRLQDHMKRFIFSASVLEMDLWFTQQELEKVVIETVAKNEVKNWYIRPVARFGYGKMGLNPTGAKVNVEVSVWPWWKYLSEKPIDVVISSFIRLHPKSAIMEAKIGGYYVNSVFANKEALKKGFNEALLLDYEGYVAEWPGENVFFVKWDTLYTPSLWTILPGITRDTIINVVAPELGLKVVETKILPEDLVNFEEAFFVWTAAEVTPIGSITLQNWQKISYTSKTNLKIKDFYMDLVHGKVSKYDNLLTYV